MTEESCDVLIDMFRRSNIFEPVSVNGLKTEQLGKGSHRATGYSVEIAEQLSKIILPFLDELICDDYTAKRFLYL